MGKLNEKQEIKMLEEKLSYVQKRLWEIDEKMDRLFNIERNHLVRIKNNEDISDEVILNSIPYNDLGPEKAFMIYNQKNRDFILLDVSRESYEAEFLLPEAIRIPLESLSHSRLEALNKHTPILVISEEGVRSILACNLLVNKGYFNLINISGGYKFWPGKKLENSKKLTA